MHDSIYVVFFMLSWILAFIHYKKAFPSGGKQQFLTLLLLYVLVIQVGFQGLYTSFQQIFLGESECLQSGRCWSPYLMEVGMMHLSFGMGGICCLWLRGSFWFAVGAGYALFLLLSVITLSYELLVVKGESLFYLRLKAYTDLVTSLLLFYLIFRRKGR